jgi:hypothetical protein
MEKFAIHGLPRSGSTWIGEIFNSCPNVCYRFQPLFSYTLKSYLGESSSVEDIEKFYEELASFNDEFLAQASARKQGKLPTFEKGELTHVGYKEVRYHQILPSFIRKAPNVKFLLIQRNPFSVISSWLNAPREFRADLGWRRLEEWRYALKKNLNRPEEFNGYEKWKEASLLFHYLSKQYPDRVMILRYDELLNDPVSVVRKAFEFLNLDYTQQTKEFLCGSSEGSTDAYSVVRSGQTDDKWKSQLEPEIIDEIRKDLEETVLKDLLNSSINFDV